MRGHEMSRVSRLFQPVLLLALLVAGPAWATHTTVRTSSWTYSATTGLMLSETVEPNGGAGVTLTTNYTRDAYGNVTQTSVVPSDTGAVTRTSTSSFGANDQFVVQQTNPLSQSESWSYDPRFGVPLTETDANGLTTSWSYDGLGRKIKETRPDGTYTSWVYTLCSGSCGPAASVYSVTEEAFGANGTQIGPVVVDFYDTLGRHFDTNTQAFDGGTIVSNSVNDAWGRVISQEKPCESPNTCYWTNYTYDTLGRVVTQTAPDGTVTSYGYNGLTTSVTNADNQTTSKTVNSQGWTMSVTDATSHTATYAYDAVGELLTTTDAAGNVASYSYDLRGRKIAMADPDLGSWTYRYDSLSQLTGQTDAKGQVTGFTYDLLGRMVQRVEPDLTSTWTYDTAAHGIGLLAQASASGTVGYAGGTIRSFTYDSLSRLTQISRNYGGTIYPTNFTYDAYGRHLTTQTGWGENLVKTFTYNSVGYSTGLTDSVTGVAYAITAEDASLNPTSFTYGASVTRTDTYDPETERLLGTEAGTGGPGSGNIQNLSYTYDPIGNVSTRTDADDNWTETETYDALNRITGSTIPNVFSQSFGYDTTGNITSKSDIGTYTYPAAGSPRPHTPVSIATTGSNLVNGVANPTYSYDANGNLLNGAGRVLTWTSFNMPATVQSAGVTLTYTYDDQHRRVERSSATGSYTYFWDDPDGLQLNILSGGGTAIGYRDFVKFSGQLVSNDILIAELANGAWVNAGSDYYLLYTDNLGSQTAMTNTSGAFGSNGRYSYEPFGKLRFASGAADPGDKAPGGTIRAYTGQEATGVIELVDLNARFYDPQIGKLLSPDPIVGDPENMQTWNRYAYVVNDPLSFTDTSGLCGIFCKIGDFSSHQINNIGSIFNNVPELGAVVEVASIYYCGGCGFWAQVAAASASTAFVAGTSSGSVSTAFEQGAIAGAEAGAFYEIGGATQGHLQANGNFPGPTPQGITPTAYFTSVNGAANLAGHGLVGGLASAAEGGSFQSGFIAAGFGDLAGGETAGLGNGPDKLVGLAASATAGGIGSVLGGGKFQDGAVTASFGYLFNQAMHTTADAAAQPAMLGIVNPQGSNAGTFSIFNYQLEDQNGDPLTGAGYSLEEDITAANDNTPPAITSNGSFVNMSNGVAQDFVGWVNVTPPQNADWTYNQTFAVKYQGQVYPLTTEFQHENISVNGNVTNIVRVVKP